MQTKQIRIIAAVVDTHNLTLYKETGETVLIPQGDSRIRPIIDLAVPLLLSQGYADVSIEQLVDTSYVEFEAVSNGAVKLFRVAKAKLLGLLGVEKTTSVDAVLPMSIGTIPSNPTMTAVEDIIQHAISVQDPMFNEVGIAEQGNVVESSGSTIKAHSADAETDTIIAVVDGKVIPGMEKIKNQFSNAAKLGSTKGIENFLRRLGTVIDSRKHSVEDLLKFMERGDLPIAEDGSILIYKVLNRKGQNYVDCHTSKVEQWVGAYVCMDSSLVDPNRNNECSNGLHVARRGYIREFSGNVCVLAKVAPEDVIAVPAYDANKMRVCGYHIIAELTPEQHLMVRKNSPITDDAEGKVLLGKALAGQHIGKTHEVRITGQQGTKVVVTELVKVYAPKPYAEVPVAEALADTAKVVAPTVDPKDVAKQVEQVSRKDKAAQLYAEGKVDELKAFKKAAKVSWDKLGVPDPDVIPPVVVPKVIIGNNPSTVIIDGVGEGSPKERIQKLLSIGLTSVGVAQAIRELKKKSKKSWDVLGVSAEQAEQIITLAQ